MKSVKYFSSCAALFLILSTSAIAGTGPNSSLTTDPSPPPADQEFAAVFHTVANVAAAGFWGETHPPSQIDGNTITFQFDEGCGWTCQSAELQNRQFPFTMPALPAGDYVVRFAATFSSPTVVYGEFNINVGNGGNGGVVSTPLPIGGYWTVIFAVLIALMAGARLLATQRNRNSAN